jgi:ketosteroid isomerase-like protein
MRAALFLIPMMLLGTSCNHSVDKETVKKEILQTEQAFAQMTEEKGIAEAFYHYAAENAVIKRENDTLIVGKDPIRAYYETGSNKDATVNWAPDFIEVSNDGTMAYTYGRYHWKIIGEKGDTTEYKGVFHTVWKRQSDNSWKYVWD